jgi:acetyl-CoA carboxylase carboxyltransferase component
MLQARQAGGDRVFAYPGALVGIAGAEATFAMLHGKEYQVHDDADRFKAAKLGMIRELPSDAREAVKAGIVDRIIEPHETRSALIAALDEIGTPARETPPRKHPDFQF